MNETMLQPDLVALVSDKDMEFALKGILSRQEALKIRSISADIFTHPEHDPGCYLRSHSFLASMAQKYAKALVLFDHDGCGAEDRTREQLEADVERRLESSGWDGRSKVIVLDPELEIWVWSDSPNVAEVLGWKTANPSLENWLKRQRLWHEEARKPHAPKEAMEKTLRFTGLPRSATRFKQLAERVGLQRCTDAAFQKLRTTLQTWFPATSGYPAS